MSCTPGRKNDTPITITKRPDGSMRLSTTCKVRDGEPRTEKSHLKECDIKNIIARYKRDGLPYPSWHQDGDIDVSNFPDFTQAQLVVAQGQSLFHSMPAHVRDRFKNEPANLLAFMRDPKNLEEAVKMGLIKMRPETATTPATPPAESKGGATKPAKTPSGKPEGGQPKGGSKPVEGGSDQ